MSEQEDEKKEEQEHLDEYYTNHPEVIPNEIYKKKVE